MQLLIDSCYKRMEGQALQVLLTLNGEQISLDNTADKLGLEKKDLVTMTAKRNTIMFLYAHSTVGLFHG